MKIAQISPIVERVPPKKYGGTERMVHALTEELVKRGHEVTLFASGDSITSAKLISVYPKSMREAKLKDLYGLNVYTFLNVGLAYQMQDEFDIIHDHTNHIGLPAANISKTPAVFTMHGNFTIELRKIFQKLTKPYVVTISNAQTKYAPNLNYIGTVYNGLDMEYFPFSEEPDNYLLFVGRISMDKGVHFAIDVALYLDIPLIIAAKLDKADTNYYYNYIEPYLSENIKWIGEVDEEERNRLMSRALAFLHPVTWPEPFGLTLIESMACGCPVIAFNRGSIPEVVEDGRTGFVVNTLEEMIEAVGNIGQINRNECRQYALEKFNAKRMTDGYEEIYRKISEKNKRHRST